MAKPKKKKSSSKKSAARKTRSARKVSKSARRVASKRRTSRKVVRGPAKAARRSSKSPKSKQQIDLSRGPLELMINNNRQRRLDPFTRKQKEKLLQLRDAMVDSMAGVAQDTLRSRAEGSEASAFGMHQADAGSGAYDRDFALSLLSQEQEALYEHGQEKSANAESAGEKEIQSIFKAAYFAPRNEITLNGTQNRQTPFRISPREPHHAAPAHRYRHRGNRLQKSRSPEKIRY